MSDIPKITRVPSAIERAQITRLYVDVGGNWWLRPGSDAPRSTDEALADVLAVAAQTAPPPAPVNTSPTWEPLLPQRVVRALAILWTVLGAIQSLGHMADITAPADGKIEEILVAAGAPVEYGQPLFAIALR